MLYSAIVLTSMAAVACEKSLEERCLERAEPPADEDAPLAGAAQCMEPGEPRALAARLGPKS